MKRSKRYFGLVQMYDKSKMYNLLDAIEILKKMCSLKFDETVDLVFRLGIDPRHADQMIRGAIVLPAGTGKNVRVLVITSGENLSIAEKAGADFIGNDDIIAKVQSGWLDFDRIIATPDMMGKIGKIGRILGPRGLMPNPKLGTVTTDVVKAVKEQKSGKIEFRSDKQGIVHVVIGKQSFSKENLLENAKSIISTIIKMKPTNSKGVYLKSISLSSSMSPGVKIDPLDVMTFGG